MKKIFISKIFLANKKVELCDFYGNNIPLNITSCNEKLEKIFFNIISNSLKYTRRGSIEIKTKYNQDKKELIFFIRDTGKGIEKTEISEIFNKFYKNKSKSDINNGLGCGLYIAKNLIESLNGKIKIESEEGEFTLVEFSIKIEVPPIVIESEKNSDKNDSTLSNSKKKEEKEITKIFEYISEGESFLDNSSNSPNSSFNK